MAAPLCKMLGLDRGNGSISYQRVSAPAPPATVWFTQTVVFPNVGSLPDTECIRRPSSVSTRLDVPFCGASGGEVNVGTVME